MAKIIIKDNKTYFRHWGKWYVVIGRQAHRIIFRRKRVMSDGSADNQS